MPSEAALISGTGRLGTAAGVALARQGWTVALADVDPDAVRRAEATLERHGHRAHGFSADVTSECAVEQLLAGVEEIAPVGCLVNAHGAFSNVPFTTLDPLEWDRVFTVNVRATMLTCRALAQRWIATGRAGTIVNVSSLAATRPRPGGAHYAASKAAVNALTQALAAELGEHGIRVNAVAPGLVRDTILHRSAARDDVYVEATLAATPLGRSGRPEEVAEAIAFLCSERSAWTTGALLEVDGGIHCGRPAARGDRPHIA